MDDKSFDYIIKKIWNGTASTKEKADLETYIAEHREQIKSQLKTHFENQPGEGFLFDKKRSEELLKIISGKLQPAIQNKVNGRSKTIYRRILAVAAIITCLLGIKMFVQFEKPKPISKPAMIALSDTIINNGPNVKLVTMPDSSTVELFPDSKICFLKGFIDRHLNLAGRARFKVVHNRQPAFTVRTDEIITTDIGTEFEIDARMEKQVTIKLLEGKIKVDKTAGSTLSMPSQYFSNHETIKIDIALNKFSIEKPVIVQKRAERSGAEQLVYRRSPLDKVFRELSVRFKTKIRFSIKDVANLTFTGTIESNDSLSNIINTICYVNDLNCSFTEQGFVITSN